VTAERRPFIVGPQEGKTVQVLSNPHRYIALGEQTGGAFGLVETTVLPSPSGPPPHIHRNEDEAFYIVEGNLSLQIEQEVVEAAAGSFVFVPRGTLHRFFNPGTTLARALFIFSPPGFEKFFEEVSQVAPAREDVDMDSIIAVAKRFDMEIVLPSSSR
jgi:mannose-6-phosphate isomerase-like protein (cupin superfamily)